jgi:hypothetical protein
MNSDQKKLLEILLKRNSHTYSDNCGFGVNNFINEDKLAEFIEINDSGELFINENKRLEKTFANYRLQDIPSYWFEKYFEFNNNEQKLNDKYLACIIRNPILISSNIQKEPIIAIGYISNNSGIEEIYALIVILNDCDGFYLLPNNKPNGNLNYLSNNIRDLNYRNLHFNDYFVFKYYPIQIDNKLMKFAISSTSNYLINKKNSLINENSFNNNENSFNNNENSFNNDKIIQKYKNEIFILQKILSDIIKIEQYHINDIINFENKINNLTVFNTNDWDTIYCLEDIFKIIIKSAIRVVINNY